MKLSDFVILAVILLLFFAYIAINMTPVPTRCADQSPPWETAECYQ